MKKTTKTHLTLYCTPQDKENFKQEAKERDMTISSYLLFLIKKMQLPPTRTDIEMAAKLLDCQPLLNRIKNSFPDCKDQIQTIEEAMESVVNTIYNIKEDAN